MIKIGECLDLRQAQRNKLANIIAVFSGIPNYRTIKHRIEKLALITKQNRHTHQTKHCPDIIQLEWLFKQKNHKGNKTNSVTTSWVIFISPNSNPVDLII
jgi:hypothetical protein